ncbi:hypothetical protein QCA50_001552 [Cerrena zonata]|uniref:Uncharacterized protein n=1 Tax=Cerrena zonata TaxID=2478898 RepID=A0AAW0GXD6_9APHY
MATIEILDLSDNPSKADEENAVQQGTLVQGSPTKPGDEATSLTKADGPQADSLSASPSPASSSTPLRGSVPNGQTAPGTTNPPTLNMPHPKKFSSVNINKKFLERSSSSAGSAQPPSTSLSSKVGSTAQKPTVPSTPSHSRLVTTKLTAGPQPATLTGPGWSRPSSTGSQGPTSASATNPKPSPLPVPSLSQGLPAAKVIHPQPRSVADGASDNANKDNSSKPAWSRSKLHGFPSVKADPVQDDFPTAAESAQARAAKLNEKRQATQALQAQKQALAAEADAFRGVHLKNTHHWDEDEGDDGDFLGGVIDFGDGRQYKVQPSEPSHSPPPNNAELEADSSTKHLDPDIPVSKEERFADDFDRSWPRSRPPDSSSRFSNGPPSSVSSQSMHSPQESSRVLFNERSNRLEPYSNSHAPRFGNREHFPRRDSRSDHAVSPTESRNGRESLSHRPGVQLLQKPAGSEHGDGPQRSRIFGDRYGGDNSRFRDKDGPRRDYGAPPHMTRTPSDSARSRDGNRDYSNPLGATRSPVIGTGRLDDHSRRTSMGPPPVPGPHQAPQPQRDDGRQIPPHLAKLQTDSQFHTRAGPPPPLTRQSLEPPSATSEAPPTHSPAASHASLSPLIEGSTMPIQDIDEVRKLAMHSAAERAKLRRQQEEAEIERQKERARKKAAELEAKMKAEEEKKEAEEKAKEQQKPSDAEVIGIIEEAVSSASLPVVPEDGSAKAQPPPPIRTAFGRTPSVKGLPRTAPARRSSFNTPDIASPATEADSWRSKAAPLSAKPVLSTHGPSKAATSPVASVLPPPPLASSHAVDSLSLADGEEVDIVDFSELGKLVGEEPTPQPVLEPAPRSRPRPVATDFFEDNESKHAGANGAPKEPETWRRMPPPQSAPEHHTSCTKCASLRAAFQGIVEASSNIRTSSSFRTHTSETVIVFRWSWTSAYPLSSPAEVAYRTCVSRGSYVYIG